MSALPPGFVLDSQPRRANLPEGFVLDNDQREPTQQSGEGGFTGFLNQGIASVVGAPVDLVNWGLGKVGLGSEEPFLGSGNITRGMRAVGVNVSDPGAKPENLTEYIGRGMGGAAGALLPGAGIVGAASRSASPVVQGVSRTVARPFVASPGRALSAEAAAGAGAGVGEGVAANVAPDNPYAQMGGALVGGVTGGMLPSAATRLAQNTPVAGSIIKAAKAEIAPFTEAGAMERARGRVGSLVEDRDAALRGLDEPSSANLSPAVRTGDPRLMGLERSVRERYPAADKAMREAESDAAQVLREGLREPFDGASVGSTRQFASQRVERIIGDMNARADRAVHTAREKVAALQSGSGQAEAAIILRDELNKALAAARNQERAIWGSVPKDQTVALDGVKQRYRELVAGLARAQRDDVPAKAREFLEYGGNQTFGRTETVREVHGLYSVLREAARNARAGDTVNRR